MSQKLDRQVTTTEREAFEATLPTITEENAATALVNLHNRLERVEEVAMGQPRTPAGIPVGLAVSQLATKRDDVEV